MADRSIAIQLKLEVDGLKRNAKEAGDALGGIGKKAEKGSTGLLGAISKNEQAISKVGTAAGVMGLAVAAGVGAAVKRFADFDKSMSAVAATGQDARDNLGALRELAIKLGADTAFSAGEAANGIEELLKAGVSAKDVLGGGLKGALDLAAAGQLEVGDAAEIAATAMVQFNLSGSQVPHVADLLAAAAGKAQGGVQDMAYALKQSGLVASQMGISVEETTGTLAAFASAGLLGSDAGTSFRTMLLRLANPTDKASDAMRAIGLNAYDASGNFIGMEAVAGQLRRGLSNLSQEQRDSTLATIFGSDAIRAANVLYQQGSEGIAEWTDEVDSAGFAAQQAAKLQDNLAGDIEKLGGSIDSALIKSGSAANDTLRSLVQTAEDAVDWIGSLDAETLQTGLKMAAMAAGALLAVSAIAKLATGLASAVETAKSLQGVTADMAKAHPKLASGLGKVARAASAVGLAFSAGAAAGAILQKVLGPGEKPVADYANALIALGKGGDGAANALNGLLDAGVWGESGTQVKDMASAFKQLAENKNPVNEALSSMGDALGGFQSAQRQVQEQFSKIDQALASLDPAQAQKAFREIARSAEEAGTSNEDLVATFPAYKAQLVDIANQMNVTTLTAEDYAKWMGGEIPAAIEQAARGNKDYAQQLNDVSGAGITAAQSLEELREEIENEAKSALDAAKSHDAYINQLEETQKQLKGAKGGIEGNSKAARQNRSALFDLVDAYQDNIEAMRKNNASTKEVSKFQNQAYEDFVKAARGAGATAEQAARLAVEYGLIPKKVTTDIGAPGAKGSKSDVEKLNKAIKDLPAEKRAQVITKYKDEGLAAAKRLLDSMKSKTIVVNINPHVNRATGNTNVGKIGGKDIYVPYASGGVLPGYTPGRDVHRFYSPTGGGLELSGGEAIMRPEFTRAVGGKSGVDRLNALARNGSLKFADGGVYRPAPLSSGRASGGLSSGGVVQQNTLQFPNLNPQAAFQAAGRYLKGLM